MLEQFFVYGDGAKAVSGRVFWAVLAQRWGTIDALRKPWDDHQMPKGMPLVAHG